MSVGVPEPEFLGAEPLKQQDGTSGSAARWVFPLSLPLP
jgi:hypothetical protein